jgi:hypothetical protein
MIEWHHQRTWPLEPRATLKGWLQDDQPFAPRAMMIVPGASGRAS